MIWTRHRREARDVRVHRLVPSICVLGLALSLVQAGSSPAGATSLDWRRLAAETLSDVAVDVHGNVYVVGTRVFSTQSVAAYLATFGPEGHRKWSRRWVPPGAASSRGVGVAVDARGAVYWSGIVFANGCERNSSRWFVRKFAPSGNVIWTRIQPGWRRCETPGVVTDLSVRGSLVVMSGYRPPCCFRDFPTDGWVQALSTNGRVLWRAPFEPPSDVPSRYPDLASGVAIGALGNVYASGWASTTSPASGGAGTMVIEKLTSRGSVLWRRSMLRLDDDERRFRIAVRGDRLMVAGTHEHGYAMWLGRFTVGGGLVWRRTWGSRDHITHATDVTIDPRFRTWVVGDRYSHRYGGIDVGFVRRYSRGGHLAWSEIIDEPKRFNVFVDGVAVDGDGVAAAGSTAPGVEPYSGVVWRFG
jgi:hypothetical protein